MSGAPENLQPSPTVHVAAPPRHAGRPRRGRPFSSLFARLAFVLLLLFAVFGAVQAIVGLWITSMHRQELDQRLNRDLAAHLVAETTILDEGKIQEAGLEHVFHMLMVINPRIEVYLLDPAGKILAYSAPEGHVERERVSLEPIRAFLADPGAAPLFGDDPRDTTRRKVFSVAPIAPDGALEGYLYVVLSGEEYDGVAERLRASTYLRLGVWTALAAAGIALVCGLLVIRLLTRRLERLDVQLQAFETETRPQSDGAGESASAVATPEPWGDEVARLERSFGLMRERILRQMDELRRSDQLRRELVANVSHDLRTPLAALQGYLETLMLKNGTLGEEERREYVEIALRHAERLGRLVADLFELTTLEAGQVEVHMEPFNVAELAQDVVQKYRLTAKDAAVDLGVVLPQNLPFVRGDIALIERVFENLLQNALRHTSAGGEVSVSLAEQNGAIEVRIDDSGCGIAPQRLPRIFDRFYRSPDDDAKGAGLGLAITRRILELHGSTIGVESEPGEGASFSFTLSVA